jgi:DNA-binding NtrC family response regulator
VVSRRPRSANGARPRPLAGLYVLVVDDDPRDRDVFRLLLAYHGAAVAVASTARSALEALHRQPADVVLVDVVLGGPEHGIWLLHEAHRRCPWVPFIVVSGADVPAEVLESTGFATYLRKPVPSALLVDSVLAAVAQATG